MVVLYLKLAFATAVVLAPGWLLARTLGVRSVSASLAWSLVAVFGALAITFALGSTLTLTLALLVLVAVAAAVLRRFRRWPAAETVPRRAWVLFWGAIVGVLLWVAAPSVQGDGLFHLARARKLLELDDLSLERVSEFADGSLHPGLRVPALARLHRADREGRRARIRSGSSRTSRRSSRRSRFSSPSRPAGRSSGGRGPRA